MRSELSTARHPAGSARQALAQAFLKRSVKMLERVSSAASSDALESALSSPTDVGGLASLLSDLAPLGVDLSAVDPFLEAMARGAAIKRELLTSGGGGLTSSQVASALGITRQAVDKRRGANWLTPGFLQPCEVGAGGPLDQGGTIRIRPVNAL